MFFSLGRLCAKYSRLILAIWCVAILSLAGLSLKGVAGDGLFDRLHTGEPRVEGAESEKGNELIAENSQRGEMLIYAITELDPDVFEQAPKHMAGFHSRILNLEGVDSAVHPFMFPGGVDDDAAAPLLADDGFVIQVFLEKDLSEEKNLQAHNDVLEEFIGLSDVLEGDGITSSEQTMVDEVTSQIQTDLQRGEVIALPISLLIMVVVFGGFLAAGIPLVGAIVSILGGLGALWGFSYLLDLDAVVVNVVTILGLGLSIDYGLLIVSRYREELRASIRRGVRVGFEKEKDPIVSAAIARTMATAGQTVTFSALTVAISVAGLMLFRLEILRSLGAAGVSVVLIALLSAITLLPAILASLGKRMAKPSILKRVRFLKPFLEKLGDVPPEQGVFSALATKTQKRPWLALLGSVAVLAFLASPALSMELRNSTTDLLPEDSQAQEFLQVINESYPDLKEPDIDVITESGHALDFRDRILSLDLVKTVGAPEEVGNGWVTLGVDIDSDDPGGKVATEVVHDLRDLSDAPQFWVTGQAANQIDFIEALLAGVPWALTVVILATLILLFFMTGSVLVPIKALLINVVSLGASLGVTSWIFGEGHLTGLLNFTSAGGLESYVVAVVVAFGFGLAMDYEVFLLSRMKEAYDLGVNNTIAVRDGLQRSGRIITSAALIIIVVFLGFIAGDLLAIKQVGVALAVTVAVDATLVRMLLVPATMTLLGEWNWWAPAGLRKLHDKVMQISPQLSQTNVE